MSGMPIRVARILVSELEVLYLETIMSHDYAMFYLLTPAFVVLLTVAIMKFKNISCQIVGYNFELYIYL